MPDSPQSVLPSEAAGRSANAAFSWQNFLEGKTLFLFVVGVCWLLFFNEISGEWKVNAQYSYGYVVPLLGAVLFWRRWPDRPLARPGKSPLLPLIVAGLLLLE